LTNLRYAWSYDLDVAKAISPTDQPTLRLQWKAQSPFPSAVGLTVTADNNIKVLGSLRFRIHTAVEAELLGKICRLRKLINSERQLPASMINPLGPDSPGLPTAHDIDRLNLFARQFLQEVEHITALNKSIKG
jgi:hypothetical protein